MTLLEQCQLWHEKDQHQKIVDALEAVPEEERTPELDSVLARAYNNLADPEKPEGRGQLRRAVELLRAHEDSLGDDYSWNFRMGYAYYFLDQEGPALRYFQRALELHPGDSPQVNTREEIRELMDDCRRRLALPRFERTFRQRAGEAWAAFAQGEAELRRLLDQKDRERVEEELMARCGGILGIALSDPAFELGFNGEKYELILSPEGDQARLLELAYFKSRAPEELQERWNVLVGRQPARGFALRSGGWEVSPEDVEVWVEKQGDQGVSLTLRCRKLLPLMEENPDRVRWMLSLLTDQALGEAAAMSLIRGFEVVEAPGEGASVPLSELPQALAGMGLPLYGSAEEYLEHGYTAYELEPDQDPDADWRMDVFAGVTRCVPLIREYLDGESGCMDRLHRDGAAAGFLCYPLEGFSGEDRGKAILDFRDALEAAVEREAGREAVTFLGGATGLSCGYLDFIAWDLPALLRGAVAALRESPAAWANFHAFRRDVGAVRLLNRESGPAPGPEAEEPSGEQEEGPGEYYTEAEMEAVENHISRYFGAVENVFHELVSPDIHVDVCLVEPTEERNYYTLVTMGMGAHRMNVPRELAEHRLERAELAIALPPDWKVDQESFRDETWYWPVRLLKSLARLPIACDTWLGWGHTVDNQEPFAGDTALCAALLVSPQRVEEGGEVCALPNGEEVNFYQVIPIHRDEMEYKQAHNAEELLDRMEGVSFVVRPGRPSALDEEAGGFPRWVMDDAAWHLASIREKGLPVEAITAYNHLAIYLRWCMEHGLMGRDFLERYWDLAERWRRDPAHTDLRPFIRDALAGRLSYGLFGEEGEAFARYYYGHGDAPYFPSDIDDYSLRYFGPARYHSDEFQDEAYLFVPFDEDYYRAMAQVIQGRWDCWQNQEVPEEAGPSELAQAMMAYLDCPCQYFPPMKDDDPITAAFGYAQRKGVRDGYIPVLVRVDETLWECLLMNSDPESEGAEEYAFSTGRVKACRQAVLRKPVKDGGAVLAELAGRRREEAEEDGMDWEEEILGAMAGGEASDRFLSYWDSETDLTFPLILARIPVKNPWEVFAWLPFGGWNECPGTGDLMAAARRWFEEYGAVPAALSHDELEFVLPAPVPGDRAMELAVEQYGFCPDVLDQGPEEATVGRLADTLRQSVKWYFWWD